MPCLTCRPLTDIIVPIYICKDTRRHKDRVYTNYRLVEAYHTPDGPRQRTVCSLGDLAPRPHHEWLALPTADGTEIRVRQPTTPEPAHLQIDRQLGVPPTLMHTRKSVHRIEA